jgi:hypothetical protein
MKKAHIPRYWFALLIAFGTVGCGAEGVENAVGSEQGVEQSEHDLTGWNPYHGGPGGSPFQTSATSPGYSGVTVSYDSNHIRQIKFLLYGGGSQGPYGGGGGTVATASCNPGWQIGGVYGYADASNLYNLWFLCLGPSGQYNWIGGWTNNSSGTSFMDTCNQAGTAITQWSGRAGAWIDGIRAYCGYPIIHW